MTPLEEWRAAVAPFPYRHPLDTYYHLPAADKPEIFCFGFNACSGPNTKWAADGPFVECCAQYGGDDPEGTAYVLNFFVNPHHRRRGIGTAFVRLLEQYLWSRPGVTEIALTPSGQGEKFWPMLGYKPRGKWDYFKEKPCAAKT